MSEIADFGLIVLVVSSGLFLAVLGTRLAERVSLPNAAIFLAVTGVLAVTIEPLGDALTMKEVERIAVVALIVILFDGGLHIGLAPLPALGGAHPRAGGSSARSRRPGSSPSGHTTRSACPGSSPASWAPRLRRPIRQ